MVGTARSAPLPTLRLQRCVRGTSRSRTCESIPIPVPKTSLILLASCSRRGGFLEAILPLGQSESWPDRGAPDRSTRLVTKVERREAQRPTSLGARGWRYQLREVGTLFPPLRVPRKHSGA